MGRIDLIAGDWQAALAALDWQVDLGVDTAVQDTPVNRYEVIAEAPAATRASPAPLATDATPTADPVAAAIAAAGRASSLPALRDALADYPHCDIRLGARNLVFSAGVAAARVMVVGEAPDIDDDRQGTPFAAAKGALFDRMFAAIGLARDAKDSADALYLTSVLPWKPPGDRAPEPEELAMMRPFLHQHITLVGPEIVVAMGSAAIEALAPGTALTRGAWGEVLGRPLFAMQHPAALLRTPAQKREAWADLLTLRARLSGGPARMERGMR